MRFCHRIIFLFFATVVLCHSVFSQEIYNLAEALFKAGLTEEARTEYLRFIFLNPEHPWQAQAYYKAGLCALQTKDYFYAEKYLKRALVLSAQENDKAEAMTKLIVLFLVQQRFAEAENFLEEAQAQFQTKEWQDEYLFLKGLLSVFKNDWKQAYQIFFIYFGQTQVFKAATAEQTLEFLKKAADTSWKDPFLAELLSYLLPGLGQIYAGEWWQACNSILLNLATLSLVVYGLVVQDYVNAIVAVLFIWQRFYLGGAYQAKMLAEKYNNNENKRLKDELFKILQKE